MQAGAYEIQQGVRYSGQVGLFLGDPEEVRVESGVRGAEEQAPGGGVDEDRAEAEQVAGRGEFEAPDLFRRHEAGRADQHAGAGQETVAADAVQCPRDAEVDDAGAVDRHQHVRRLEVAVDQARLVHGPEGEGEAVGQGADRVLGQRPEVLADHGGQVRARNVLRRHPGRRRLGVGVEHSGSPVPADPPGGGDLAGEAPAEFGVLGVLGLHDLHRDRAAEIGPPQIDQAHSALAEPGDQTVGADVCGVLPRQLFHGDGSALRVEARTPAPGGACGAGRGRLFGADVLDLVLGHVAVPLDRLRRS
ncbi:hypothetical protein P376_0875 [Streptomyces sp. HCCB10043]|nr:hypothetical protein P376_0875 [Streptomyces sp. HCCB10043]